MSTERPPWETEVAPWDEPVKQESEFIEEQHPDVTVMERAIVKNLAQSPEKGAEYIRSKHPDMEVKLHQGRYLMRNKNDPGKFKVLDPDTGIISKDILGDITDIGYDILSGGAETAAGIGGAMAGAPAGALGAIPASMAASGAIGAGMEGIRQLLGQYAGIPQDVSGTDVAISGGVGAAAPLMFGTGASGKQLAKAGVKKGAQLAEKGLGGLTKEKIGQGVGGVYQAGAKHIPARVAEVMSGISEKVYKDYIENPDVIKQIDKAKGMAGHAENKIRDFYKKLTDVKSKISKEYDKLEKMDVDVDVSEAKRQILDLRETIAAGAEAEGLNADQRKLVKDLDSMYNDLFKVTKEVKGPGGKGQFVSMEEQELGNTVKVKKALELKKILKKYEDKYSDMTRSDKSAFDKALVTKARGVNTQLSQKLEEAAPRAGEISEAWADVINDYDFLESELKNLKRVDPKFKKEHAFDKKGKRYLKSASVDSEEGADKLLRLQEMDDKYGSDLVKTSNMLKAYDQLRKAPTWPISGGATSTTRTLGGAALGGMAGSQTGEGYPILGTALGAVGGSPKLWKGALQAGQAPVRLAEFLGSKQLVPPSVKQAGIRTGLQGLKPRREDREDEY